MSDAAQSILTRRETLQLGAAAVLGGLMGPARLALAENTKAPSMHVYPDYAWLREFSTRRDRYDYNGLNCEGFHPFFTRKGKLRGGLEFLQEPPKLLPPWMRKTGRRLSVVPSAKQL